METGVIQQSGKMSAAHHVLLTGYSANACLLPSLVT